MRWAASRGDTPKGTCSVRNSPMISPAWVRSSSPTTTRHGSRPASSWAPLTAWWSVMQSTSSPQSVTACSSSSAVVVESPDHMVWECRSARTQPEGTGAARCGCLLTASAVARRRGGGGGVTTPGSDPAHGDVADDERDAGRAHRQPVDVAPHLDDVLQHPLQGRGDRELPYRLGQLAAADHEARGAGREVARHGVHARVQPLHHLDEHALVDVGDELGLAPGAMDQGEGQAAAAG